MATSIQQAVNDHAAKASPTRTYGAAPAATGAKPRPGTDGADFLRANRIHVEHGSLFIDPYLVIHPRELDPANEAALRAKLQLTYSIDNPNFFESPDRAAIALNLGQLVPVSLQAKQAQQKLGESKLLTQIQTGIDPDLLKQVNDKRAPFAAIVQDTMENPGVDPVGFEVLKNGLAVYLLLREKLTQQHFLGKLTDYVVRAKTPDQVLNDLAPKIGITPREIREAALSGGLDGVGKLLGVDPAYVADVKRIVDQVAVQDFSYNVVEHWHLGRQLLGVHAPIGDKLTTGMDARITAKIGEYRGRVRHHYDVPESIRAEEERIAVRELSLVEPIQRQLAHALGYEFCYTPETTADRIAFHRGIYGLHRRASNDLNSFVGTNRIFFSGHGTRERSSGTLCHEVAHNFWPNYFSKPETARIDTLAASDQSRFASLQNLLDTRFDEFEKLFNAYRAGDPKEKAAVLATTNERFASYGITFDTLFPHLIDAHSLRFLVWDANDVLQIEGARYNKSGYDTPQERFREVISRFAEMRQVSHRDNPGVLRFVAPGLTEVWESHYIPHLERVYKDVVAQKQARGQRTDSADAAPDTSPLPKVEERITPTPSAPVREAAERADDRTPGTSGKPINKVLADTVQRNDLTHAALSALRSL